MRPGLALEDREAVADLDQPEGQRLRNRRRRNLAVDHRLHELPAGHSGRGFRLAGVRTVGDCHGHDVVSL